MDENTLLINIATVLTKDILADGVKKPGYHTGFYGKGNRVPTYPLLESDDEGFMFFYKQQNLKNKNISRSVKNKKVSRRPDQIPIEPKPKKSFLNRTTTPTTRRDFALEVNLLNDFDPHSFESYLHMSKATFLKIFKSLRHLLVRSNIPEVPPQTIFSLALWKLSTDEHFEEISRRFQIPLHSCHVAIRHFWHLISENYESYIKWPNSQMIQQTTLGDFQSIPNLTAFKNLFGLIAIRRLDIFLESEDEEVSVILQIICNAKEKIIDCFVELANEYCFERTPIGQTLDLNVQTIPPGSYIIGDNSFPLRRFLMRPFEIECFRKETVFNRMLQPALAMGQRVLDNMAERFHTVYALEAKDMSEVRKILETVCSLYNLCVDHQDSYISKRQPTVDTHGKIIPSVSTIKGSEQNVMGRKTRVEVMESVLKYENNTKI